MTDLEVRLAQLESKRAHDPDDERTAEPTRAILGRCPLHDPNPPPGTPDVAQMLPDPEFLMMKDRHTRPVPAGQFPWASCGCTTGRNFRTPSCHIRRW